MSTVIKDFDAISIKNSSIQYLNAEGQDEGEFFGSIGSISGSTILKELIKNVEGTEAKKRVRPEKMELTISAHVPIAVYRKLYGITNKDLKPGVYSYSIDAKGEEFIYTADVIDEFEDVTKLIAFPRCISSTGLQFSIENGASEVAEMELTITVYKDAKNQLMYEAFVDEVTDETVKAQWHTAFTPELVELVPEP